MTPILYEKDEIDFTSQGLGSLVEIYDVDVEEQRNGLLQLTASYPVSGVRYADISVGRIILAKPNQRDNVHAFRIVSTELDISGYSVAIEADSITYDLTHNLVKHLNVSGNGQAFMTALKNAIVNPSIFNFYSDINHVSSTSLDYVNPMEVIMGVKGSFLQIWGGELKRENRRVAMFNRRGRDNVSTFRLGKNISGLKYSVDISSLVTRIIPTKSVQNDDQTTTILEGAPIDSQYINNYEQIYTLPLEFTDDSIKTVADLNVAAKGWFTKSANTGRDKPTVTIDIDVLSLQDSADYQDKFKNLESVSLTDTVTVYVPEYGVNVTAIVNELHYDPILDRVTKMTVGTAKQSFADSSRTQLSDLQDKIISVQNQADATAVSANGKSTNYYGSVEPSHPQEGDTWFWVNGDKSGIKVFVNGDWVEPVDSDTQEKIEAAVTDAVTQAKAHTDEVKQGLSSDIATAKSQAASLASTAEANAKSAATSQFNQAQNALSDAKTDLKNGIASEASARNAAVAAANSQAQTYANQAKADALNTIAKEVTDRQNAVSALDTKATNAINQAKSDINDTIKALSVGGRNLYLNSRVVADDYGTNGSVTVTVEPFDSTTNMWHIVAAQGSGGNVGIYIFDYGSGKIPDNSDWCYSADVKGRGNVIQFGIEDGNKKPVIGTVGSEWSRISQTSWFGKPEYKTIIMYFDSASSPIDVYIKLPKLELGNVPTAWTPAPEDVVLDYTTKDNQIKETITQYQETNDGKVSKVQTDVSTALGQVATKVSQTDYDQKTGDLSSKYTQVKQTVDSQATDIVDIKAKATSQASKINSISSDVDGTKQSISDIETTQDSQSDKINQITNDVNGTKQSITDIQTKDDKQDARMGTIETSVSGVKSDFSSYKTTNDGVVQTAQTTAQTAVDGLKNKVSQTDYNTKTGQLQTDLTDTTQTANQAKTDIASIKQKDGEQDEKMNTIVSDANGTKQTVSDLQTAQGKQSGDISTLQQRADGFDATVTKVDNLSVGSRNLLIGTRDWTDNTRWNQRNTVTTDVYRGMVIASTSNPWTSPAYTMQNAGILQVGKTYTFSAYVRNTSDTDTKVTGFYDGEIVISVDNIKPLPAHTDWMRVSTTFKVIKDPTTSTDKLRWEGNDGLTNGFIQFAGYKLEEGNLPTDWTPAPEDIQSDIAQVKITADSISNFVRDSSGNISSNFQTALSKTSIITGSTLATSIQKQTSSQISSALTDNNGKIISLINQDSSGVQIAGKNIVLDGDTTVTGKFYAKGGNFTNLNASNIIVGTLNGNTVNITNINASNIVTGAISGANLNINLNTGQVVFQKGRIYNEGVQTSGAGIDVNIDQRYIATSDGYSSSVLKNGMMMLYQSTLVNSGKDPYFQIDNFGTQLTFEGARLRGSKNISLGVYSSSDVPVFGGHSELNGAVFSDGYAARIEGKDKGVKVSGGAAFGSISPASPNILVGVDSLRSGFGGDRIAVNAKYFYLLNQYATTTSSGANMFLTDDGAVIRSSSSSKYKLNINYEQSSETANRLLTIDPALWHDKFESEQLDKFHDIGIEPERTIDMDKRWYYGIIAEDLVKAGLEHLVMRDTKTGEVEGVEYSKIGVALIPIIRELRNRLNEQYVEIERLKEQSK